ncbi:hypothetical protein RYA05_06340 [Pseudomonas syringae pv. actinidiae]|nr:hypothetical protein [Pseudomonas syringae pv. actinidiae]
MKLPMLVAAVLSCISYSVVASTPHQETPRTTVQAELNDKWAIPIITAYSAYRCGMKGTGDSIIDQLLKDASPGARSSVITYGFMLSYSDHLSSIDISQSNKDTACARVKSDLDNTPEQPNSGYTLVDNNTSLGRIFERTKIKSMIGERRANGLLVSAHNIEQGIGTDSNVSVLAQACSLPDATDNPPTLLTLINAAKLTGSVQHQDFVDITDLWVGYTQGLYWHARSLLESVGDKKRKELCSNIYQYLEGQKDDKHIKGI